MERGGEGRGKGWVRKGVRGKKRGRERGGGRKGEREKSRTRQEETEVMATKLHVGPATQRTTKQQVLHLGECFDSSLITVLLALHRFEQCSGFERRACEANAPSDEW